MTRWCWWADLAQAEELVRAVAQVLEAFGRVDVLVNAAGTDVPGPVAERWRR